MTSGAVTFSGSTVTVNPAADLTSLTGYYMKVEATAVDDLTGNSYAESVIRLRSILPQQML